MGQCESNYLHTLWAVRAMKIFFLIPVKANEVFPIP